MGMRIPQNPEYSAIAHYALSAFRVIERSRLYFDVIPKPLDAKNIIDYFELYESPCPEWLLIECIFAIDNAFIEKVLKNKAQKA